MSLELLARNFNELRQRYEKRYIQNQDVVEQVVEQPEQKPLVERFVTVEKIWNDAMSVLQSNQFYAISVVGPQGSGKSTIAEQVAKLAKGADFKLVYALPDDFLPDMEPWIRKILEKPRAKNCLIIDDMSYAADTQSRSTQAKLKNLVSRFRHVFGGQLLLVYVTHRLHAAPPILRNSATWIFSSMQSADRDDARLVIGRSKETRDRLEALYQFIAKAAVQGPKDKIIKFTLGDQEFDFKWGNRDDPGDGRLMVSWHEGKLEVFCVKVLDTEINLKDYRYPTKPENSLYTDRQDIPKEPQFG